MVLRPIRGLVADMVTSTNRSMIEGGNATAHGVGEDASAIQSTAPNHQIASEENEFRFRRVNVLLLISSLEYGGAERQVIELYRNLDRRRFEPTLCCLSGQVPLAKLLPDEGRELEIIEKSWKYDITVVTRLARLMRDRRIDLVHTFLFDADFSARLAAPLAGWPVVLNSERNAQYRRPLIKMIGFRITRPLATGFVANSNAGKQFTEQSLRLPPNRVFVVRNGVRTDIFHPDQEARAWVRTELGIEPNQPLIGMIASFKPQKNHRCFLAMAKLVLERNPDARFICVGEPLRNNYKGSADNHRLVTEMVANLGLGSYIHFLGHRSDLHAIYNACDITVLSSHHEGTPNVLLESMACGVPVVATNVSDNAQIVPNGVVGYIVPRDDEYTMTERISELLGDRQRLREFGTQARQWVEHELSTAALARNTESVYLTVLERFAPHKLIIAQG